VFSQTICASLLTHHASLRQRQGRTQTQ
jgi:hypothetical protein